VRAELAILELLERHGPLGYEQIAVQLDGRPDDVRASLTALGGAGFVLRVVDGASSATEGAWQLTDAGRDEVAQWR
jgi:predicted ArsR family transcriptional regulator